MEQADGSGGEVEAGGGGSQDSACEEGHGEWRLRCVRRRKWF